MRSGNDFIACPHAQSLKIFKEATLAQPIKTTPPKYKATLATGPKPRSVVSIKQKKIGRAHV